MAWSKVKTKFIKPLGWWYHKVMCELKYHLKGSGKGYYYHLNKMCDNYNINLYGERMLYYAQKVKINTVKDYENSVEMYDLDNIWDAKVISKKDLNKHFALV